MALGATFDINTNKGARGVVSVPVTATIGKKVFLAMTFRMNYQQIGHHGNADSAH